MVLASCMYVCMSECNSKNNGNTWPIIQGQSSSVCLGIVTQALHLQVHLNFCIILLKSKTLAHPPAGSGTGLADTGFVTQYLVKCLRLRQAAAILAVFLHLPLPPPRKS